MVAGDMESLKKQSAEYREMMTLFKVSVTITE